MSFEEEREQMHIQMMSAVSHDLKTPLASVIGSLEIYNKMKSVLPAEKQAMLIETALKEAYRLDRFVSNILDMAKLDNGLLRPHFQECTIQPVITEIIRKCTEKYPHAQFDLSALESRLELRTDPGLLSRALLCVVENAVIHGSETPHIHIHETMRLDEAIIISVCDNGPGIEAEDHEKVFDKYTRLTRKDHKHAGTGLGLTIGRKIMRLLGGDLRLGQYPNSNMDQVQGACFELSIPLKVRA